MGLFDRFKKDKAKKGVDQAAEVADDKLGDKVGSDKVDDAADKANDAIDKLPGD